MSAEQLTTILLAAMAAPGFWELLKTGVAWLLNRKRVTIEEIGKKIDSQGRQIESLERSFTSKAAEDEEKEAKACRRRILRADDEIRLGMKHSKDFFEDVLRDIDAYEEYCDSHPHFKNRCAESAIRNVAETYDMCKAENSFL